MVLALHYITHYRITTCEQNQLLSEGIVLAAQFSLLISKHFLVLRIKHEK